MILRGFVTSALLGALLFSNLTLAQTGTTKRPNPPAQVCIGAQCVSTPSQNTNVGALKFHPGFYPYFNYAGGVTQAKFNYADQKLISTLKPGDNVAGIAIAIMWRSIDNGSSAPNYDWSLIDAYLKAVKSVNKRLWVRVQDAAYGANKSVANGTKIVPDWLINKYGAQTVMINYSDGPRGVAAKRYSPVVTQAYVAMYQAMAARYDSDPSFEGVTLNEETAYAVDSSGSSVTMETPGADYTVTGMFNQLYALMAGVRDPNNGFKTSNVQLSGNYLFQTSDSAAGWLAVIQHVQQYKMMLGSADSWIASWTYRNLPYDGPQAAGPGSAKATNPSYTRASASDENYRGWWAGSVDWRGKILFGPDVEATDFGGYVTRNLKPIPTLDQIWQVRNQLDHAHYFFFDINFGPTGNYGGPPQQWSTGQYPWVQQAGATNTTNPYN
jgi:hypothetical protein